MVNLFFGSATFAPFGRSKSKIKSQKSKRFFEFLLFSILNFHFAFCYSAFLNFEFSMKPLQLIERNLFTGANFVSSYIIQQN
ncbi:MAG: hypothetical protein COX39_01905 [Candidatus Nealsonbacteria bacterium CG23_combo_of_CG06-09_8_20_14_all_40_13]|uniref:Uncharacterized protein n=1 Tax=Candidatus Nealsonbacteria bacterium CG23_combo_of_CG06-09_8_20_14_all_40_13 TaxID=1974724 RepID=A0A2G9YQY5_9BACT|nr:MAG: hypothetical protein COX39_01905 [Candidatus Nealsonbacteria bacterium CG23_combo_of_CG06-09_8_20_14_all_40_13]PIR70870.1 MAG: hypothetical protein COU44_02740 [Candidatus Nealsonbacteria bacterium CG10_big_fil_rev_8_21_14_0_10_40_24]